MAAAEQNQPAAIEVTNKPVKDAPKQSKLRSAVLNPAVHRGVYK